MARGRCGNLRSQHGIGAMLALVQLVGALSLMVIYSPSLMLAFLATTPLYGGLMYFSQKVLRPLFAGVEESQGKYSSHQIDAIKGIEAVKAAAAETVFRDMMLNEFLSVSQKIFRSSFIVMTYDSVLQTHRDALDRDLSLGRREPGDEWRAQRSAVSSPSARSPRWLTAGSCAR